MRPLLERRSPRDRSLRDRSLREDAEAQKRRDEGANGACPCSVKSPKHCLAQVELRLHSSPALGARANAALAACG